MFNDFFYTKCVITFIKKHVPFLIMSFILLLMIAFLIVLGVLKNSVEIAEAWTRTFGRWYTKTFGEFNEKFSFSITEVSFVIVIISCVVFLAWGFSLLGNKKIWPFIHRMLMVSLIVVGTITIYNASVGMAYVRKPLPLERYKGEIKKEEFVQIATYFVEDCNDCANQLEFDDKGEIVLPYSKKDMIEKLRVEFIRLTDDYYNSYTPMAKALISSPLFTSVSIVGMYFGVLGEANYNTHSTNAELPFYIAHEMAHGKGVMREDDAQLLATYICLTSEDSLFRYSAYYNTMDRILNILTYTDNKDDYKNVKSQISEKVWTNFNYIYDHWKGEAFLSEFGDKVNDIYLKLFGQKGGTSSYTDTDTDVDDQGKVAYLSNYQSIYFKIYYDKKA